MTDDPYAELESALAPLRAAYPGITNHEVAPMLPPRLRSQLWERAVQRELEARLAEVEARPKRPTAVVTVQTSLNQED